jgi:Universal stress protein family
MTVVLAAIDGTEAAKPVLGTTLVVARTLHAQPQALHARVDGIAVAEEEAAAADVPLTIVDTEPVPAIVKAAEDPSVDLVVLALHRQPPGPHPAGYTALAVMTQVAKPLMIVPPGEPVREQPRRALVPLDGTQAVSAALRATIKAFKGAGLEVVVLHVFDQRTVPRFLDDPRDLDLWGDEFLTRNLVGFRLRLEVRSGDPATAVVATAGDEDVDVIALGWHQDLSAEHAAVIRRVLAEAGRPVLLVPILEDQQAG